MTKSKIAVLATLAALVAAPAFAGDQNTATELQDSGRYVPQTHLGVYGNLPSDVYASARNTARAQIRQSDAVQDFQLVGHN